MKIIKSLITFANIAVFLFASTAKSNSIIDLLNNEQKPNAEIQMRFVQGDNDKDTKEPKKLDATAVEAASKKNKF